MAKKTTKNSLWAKMGAEGKKGFNAHKKDETEFDTGGSLPPGIEGGIAQLNKCYFDTYKKGDMEGEYYWYASGIVVEPKEYEGRKIEGKMTSIMEGLYDTPKSKSRQTVADHWEWVLNELRKLGLETADMDPDQIEEACTALADAGIFFEFRTWQGKKTTEYPNPRVQHVWNGACEYDGESSSETVDSTGDDDDSGDDYDDDEGNIDLTELGEQADNEDEDAAKTLNDMALEAGYDQSSIDETSSWAELAAMLLDGGEDEPSEDDQMAPPKKGDVFMYKPPRAKKAVKVEITAVFEGKEQCNAKRLDTGVILKGVAWDKLTEVE